MLIFKTKTAERLNANKPKFYWHFLTDQGC